MEVHRPHRRNGAAGFGARSLSHGAAGFWTSFLGGSSVVFRFFLGGFCVVFLFWGGFSVVFQLVWVGSPWFFVSPRGDPDIFMARTILVVLLVSEPGGITGPLMSGKKQQGPNMIQSCRDLRSQASSISPFGVCVCMCCFEGTLVIVSGKPSNLGGPQS